MTESLTGWQDGPPSWKMRNDNEEDFEGIKIGGSCGVAEGPVDGFKTMTLVVK